ncbi:hypothetical protein COOONC_02339 [Cooperia oncophora]
MKRPLPTEWHSTGVNVFYVGVGEPANKTNMDNIATDPDHEKIIPDLKKEEPDQLQNIVKWMLDLVNKDAEDQLTTTESTGTEGGSTKTTTTASTKKEAGPLTRTSPDSSGNFETTFKGLEGTTTSVPLGPSPESSTQGTSESMKSVVFIVDASSPALRSAWKKVRHSERIYNQLALHKLAS